MGAPPPLQERSRTIRVENPSQATRLVGLRAWPSLDLDGQIDLNILTLVASTSLHIPEDLLRRLDRRAKALSKSRNRVIIETLEHGLRDTDEWSPEFLEALDSLRPSKELRDAARALSDDVVAKRTSKKAPSF